MRSDFAGKRKVVRLEEMDRAIAEGRLTVRTMAAEEWMTSDAHWTRRGQGPRGESKGLALALRPDPRETRPADIFHTTGGRTNGIECQEEDHHGQADA
jgi:hypothetical protein